MDNLYDNKRLLALFFCLNNVSYDRDGHDYDDALTKLSPQEYKLLNELFDWVACAKDTPDCKAIKENGLLGCGNIRNVLERTIRIRIEEITEKYPDGKAHFAGIQQIQREIVTKLRSCSIVPEETLGDFQRMQQALQS